MSGTAARLAGIILLVILVVAAWFLLGSLREDSGPPAPAPTPVPEAAKPPPLSYTPDPAKPLRSGSVEPLPTPEKPLELPRMIALAETLNDPDASVEEDLEVVAELLLHYQQTMKRVPAGGLNEEIVAGLRGRNERKLVFIAESNARLNENGELLDRFGSPYYLHPVSDRKIEVRSKGPDKTLWTKDDIWLGEEAKVDQPGAASEDER